MSKRALLLASLVLVTGFAPAPFPRARRGDPQVDLAKMQGSWVVTKYQYSDQDYIGLNRGLQFAFEGRRLKIHVGDDVRSEWDVELFATSAPRAFTKTDVSQRSVLKGIYRFDGNKLTMCEEHRSGRPRPTEFSSRDGQLLIVMERRLEERPAKK